MMDTTNIVDELRAHNRWRCGGAGPATDARRLTMLIDAACDALEQAGWRDIASAPRDGSEFQAWVVGEDGGYGLWEPSCHFAADGRFGVLVQIYDSQGWDYDVGMPPTHWMPQPSAPTPRTA